MFLRNKSADVSMSPIEVHSWNIK